MKRIKTIAIAAILIGSVASTVIGQENGVVRKRNSDEKEKNAAKDAKVTERMQSFFESKPMSDADLTWMKVVYRQLDLKKEKNMALYFPEEPTENEENLFRLIMRLLSENQISAYEYLDGREVFTDQYRIKVKDMLDRFHVLYSEAKGSTEKNPKFKIEESDVPSNEVLSYYILERWEFDRRQNAMKQKVEAICPVLHRAGDFGGEAIKYPMFWIKYDVLRPYMMQQNIFVDNDNNKARYNYDDFFQLALYDGSIYKTKNLRNMSMMQLYPDPDDMKRAQDSIETRLRTYDKGLWVPSREELAAIAEAKALKESGDTTFIAEKQKTSVKENRSTSKRGQKENTQKVKKPKQQKVKQSNSSANRSVRRRK